MAQSKIVSLHHRHLVCEVNNSMKYKGQTNMAKICFQMYFLFCWELCQQQFISLTVCCTSSQVWQRRDDFIGGPQLVSLSLTRGHAVARGLDRRGRLKGTGFCDGIGHVILV